MAEAELSRQLPHNIDAERAVLGAILMDNEAINVTMELITGTDFYQTSHTLIYETMLELYEEEKTFDVLTLVERLQQKKKLKDIGGQAYLVSLLESIPTSVNISHYASIVSQKSLSRQLLTVSNHILHECIDDGEPISDILDRAEQKIFTLAERRIKTNVVHISKVIKDNFERVDQLYRDKKMITGVPSGFHDLDMMTSGFQPSDLIIIAARPSVGKTSFLLNMTEHISVMEGLPVLFFSLEMSKESLANRLLCGLGKIDSHKMRTGYLNQDDWARLREAADRMYKAPIYIDDTPGMTILEMRAKARRWKSMYDIQIILIDYLQLMRAVGKVDSRQQEISQISGALKGLAKELKVPVIVCSQLSRDIEKRREKEPKLSDLRESGSIEQDGDVIGFLHRPEQEQDISLEGQSTIVEFVLGKQRNGPTGSFRMVFMNKYTRFQCIARAAHGGAPPPTPPPDLEEMAEDFEPPI